MSLNTNQHIPVSAKTRVGQIQQFFGRGTSYLEKDFNLRMRAEIVKSLTGPVSGSNLLDIGCGDGSISRQFLNNGNRAVLVDISGDMLNLAKNAAPRTGAFECKYLQANFLDQSLPEQFDLILCLGVLAHAPSVDDAFRRIRSQLHDNGRCIIQWTDHERLAAKVNAAYGTFMEGIKDIYGYSLNRLKSADVIRVARGQGLVPVSLTRYCFMLPGMGRLPNEVLYKFQRLTLRNPILRAFSMDVIGLFSARSRPAS